tara:strand:- start:18 stop:257 length:240 start_codon:yes stop_codon:yes gene_type:complete
MFIVKMIYLVVSNTEFYQSPLKIHGTYDNLEDALKRIQTFGVEESKVGAWVSWRTVDKAHRFFLRKYPEGDCTCSIDGI